MKVLGLAHLTVCAPHGYSPGIGAPKFEFSDISNPGEKFPLMTSPWATHDIRIFEGRANLEITSYGSPSDGNVPEPNLESLVAEALGEGFIRSSAFTSDSLKHMAEVLGIPLRNYDGQSLTIPTLFPGQSATLVSDKNGPRFQTKLDKFGLVAIAVYVSGISEHEVASLRKRAEVTAASSVFTMKLDSQEFDICFVSIGRVRIELLSRVYSVG